jgi:hypothetical protein
MSNKILLRKVRTIVTAEPRKRALFIKAIALVGLFRVLLEMTSFKTARAAVERMSKTRYAGDTTHSPFDLANAVRLASGNMLRERPCLPQALALSRTLSTPCDRITPANRRM